MRHDEQDALAGGILKRFGPEQKELSSSDLDDLRFVLRLEVGQKFENSRS